MTKQELMILFSDMLEALADKVYAKADVVSVQRSATVDEQVASFDLLAKVTCIVCRRAVSR